MATLNIATVVTANGTVDHTVLGSKYGITIYPAPPGRISIYTITIELNGVTNEILYKYFRCRAVKNFLVYKINPFFPGYDQTEFTFENFTTTTDFDFVRYLAEYNALGVSANDVRLYMTYQVTVFNADTSVTQVVPVSFCLNLIPGFQWPCPSEP
jgi:hypothetical protein